MSEASELLVEVTILAVLFATILLIHYKSVMSGFLGTWVGLLLNGVGLFWRERVLENIPTPPALSSHLSSSPMGVFSRDYSIVYCVCCTIT